MKKTLLFRILYSLFFILFIAGACTKNQEAKIQQTPPGIPGTILQEPVHMDTLVVEDDNWPYQNGYFTSNLEYYTGGINIFSLSVSEGGLFTRIANNNSIPWRGGTLSFRGKSLYFSAPYGQLPFHSLFLTLITTE